MRCLLIYLKPKDELYEVDEALKEIPCDKLILKYFPYPTVYKIAMKTIKEHEEYSHIIWIQNDIVFTKEAFNRLTRGVQRNSLTILGASMNVDLSPNGLSKCAFTTKKFDFDSGYMGFIGSKIPYAKHGEYTGIIRVYHNGGPFIAEREFFLKFPLRGFGKSGYNADIEQGQNIYREGFDYFLDADLHLKHLRYLGTMQVGKKEPKVEFIKYE